MNASRYALTRRVLGTAIAAVVFVLIVVVFGVVRNQPWPREHRNEMPSDARAPSESTEGTQRATISADDWPEARRPTEESVRTSASHSLAASVQGCVEDPTGRRLAEAVVRVIWHDSHGESTSDTNGLFTVRVETTSAAQSPSPSIEFHCALAGHQSFRSSVLLNPDLTAHLGRVILRPSAAIELTVEDERGVAVDDVAILCYRNGIAGYRRKTTGPEPQAFLPRAVPLETLTANIGRGHYRVDALPEGSIDLWVRADGSLWTCAFDVRSSSRPDDTPTRVILVSPPTVSVIEGVVVTPDGNPYAAASLRARDLAGDADHVLGPVDQKGHFELVLPTNGTYLLRAVDARSAFVSNTPLEVRGGDSGLELALRSPPHISVRIHTQPETADSPVMFRIRTLDDAGEWQRATTTGDQPVVMSFVAPTRSFWLSIYASGHARWESDMFEPASMPSELDCYLTAAPVMTGLVTRSGLAVAEARVSLHKALDLTQRFVSKEVSLQGESFDIVAEPSAIGVAQTTGLGEFCLPFPTSTYFYIGVEVEHQRHWLGPYAVEDATAKRLDVDLLQPGAIAGRVSELYGGGPSGLIVGASCGNGVLDQRRTDEAGRFEFASLAPGTWQVRICAPNAATVRTLRLQRASTEMGEPTWDCQVAPGAVSTITLGDLDPNACYLNGRISLSGVEPSEWTIALFTAGCMLLPTDRPLTSTSADDSGRFVLRTSTEGEHCLVLRTGYELYVAQNLTLHKGVNRWEATIEAAPFEVEGVPPRSPNDQWFLSWESPNGTRVLQWVGDATADGRLVMSVVPRGESRLLSRAFLPRRGLLDDQGWKSIGHLRSSIGALRCALEAD